MGSKPWAGGRGGGGGALLSGEKLPVVVVVVEGLSGLQLQAPFLKISFFSEEKFSDGAGGWISCDPK